MSFKMQEPSYFAEMLDGAIKALQKSPTNGNLIWTLKKLEDWLAYCERLYNHCEKQRDELAMWHQRYEGEKMEKKGITDELRECMRTATRFYEDMRNPYNDRERLSIAEDELTAIADRIDDQHEAELQAEYINGYHKALEEVKDGYIKLPVDSDGVPIHVGDRIKIIGGEDGTAAAIELTEGGWSVSMRPTGWDTPTLFSAETVRHVRPDSWERIIEDAMHAFLSDDSEVEPNVNELVERCRRLADDL